FQQVRAAKVECRRDLAGAGFGSVGGPEANLGVAAGRDEEDAMADRCQQIWVRWGGPLDAVEIDTGNSVDVFDHVRAGFSPVADPDLGTVQSVVSGEKELAVGDREAAGIGADLAEVPGGARLADVLEHVCAGGSTVGDPDLAAAEAVVGREEELVAE